MKTPHSRELHSYHRQLLYANIRAAWLRAKYRQITARLEALAKAKAA